MVVSPLVDYYYFYCHVVVKLATAMTAAIDGDNNTVTVTVTIYEYFLMYNGEEQTLKKIHFFFLKNRQTDTLDKWIPFSKL
jgi:hypothetical protein